MGNSESSRELTGILRLLGVNLAVSRAGLFIAGGHEDPRCKYKCKNDRCFFHGNLV
jgi:hypothetical protein